MKLESSMSLLKSSKIKKKKPPIGIILIYYSIFSKNKLVVIKRMENWGSIEKMTEKLES